MSVAEKKYDLALFQTKTEKRVREQPWYKERLQTKLKKSLKPTDTSKCLVGKNWIFVKDGLDDFRDGLPPPVKGDVLIKNAKGPGPNVQGSSENLSPVKQPAVRGRFTMDQICFSRCTPLQQQRRDHIDEIEYGLTQHPLALYPHLEESVPPEIFEDIVDILDPEMNMESTDASLADVAEENEESEKDSDSLHSDEEEEREFEQEEGVPRNPYRWLPRKEEKEKKDKRKPGDKGINSASEEEHIKSVTKDFCDWVASLGGESNNIEESTITSLFASGYETKPALSVPIHVVELTNVPPELRMSAAVPQQQPVQNLPQQEKHKKNWLYSGGYEPSWVKFKYGAWYLTPNTWEKRDWTEPLVDPKKIREQADSEAKQNSEALNQELSTMHGAKAFMDFMGRKGTRKPEFLDDIAEIQRKQAEEEQQRLEAEQAAKQRRSHLKRSTTEKKS
ncbi:hypothetical protein ScPMuIL_010676 [Solemya velum]